MSLSQHPGTLWRISSTIFSALLFRRSVPDSQEKQLDSYCPQTTCAGKSFPPFKCRCQLHQLSVSSYFPPGAEFPSSSVSLFLSKSCDVEREKETPILFYPLMNIPVTQCR